MANTYSLDLEAGSSQYAYRADTASLSLTGDCTFEFWILRESININATILTKWRDSGTNKSYGLEINSNNDIVMYISANGSAYTGGTFTLANLTSTTNWYHIAIAYDASAGSAELYVNGTSIQTITGLPTSIYNSTEDFAIGRDWSYGQYYDGLIDEVRIWSDIRTAQEIVDNMSVQLVGNEAGLNAYWQFNNGYLDMTANDNDLTAVNNPVFSTTVPFSGAVGPANLKSYNTNLKANIKTINTNLIANVKTLNTNA